MDVTSDAMANFILVIQLPRKRSCCPIKAGVKVTPAAALAVSAHDGAWHFQGLGAGECLLPALHTPHRMDLSSSSAGKCSSLFWGYFKGIPMETESGRLLSALV